MADAIKLDSEDVFLQFEIHGHTFDVDLSEAVDLLREQVDQKHADDPQGSQAFLDTTVGILKDRWQVPKCGRSAAWAFYQAIVNAHEELKKTTGLTPESATGSESTAEDGAEPESGSDSTISTDATPSEICASLT